MTERSPLAGLFNVWKRYARGGDWVLRDVRVEIARGRVVHVRGDNGSGKSTLLRLLAGTSEPSRGTCTGPVQLPVGYAPDGLETVPVGGVATFLTAHARLRGLTGRRTHDEVNELSAQLGAESILGARLDALSRGSLQKVLIVQALLGSPALVVLDEPFATLDSSARGRSVSPAGRPGEERVPPWSSPTTASSRCGAPGRRGRSLMRT